MRKDLGVKTFLYPQPVLILSTYDQNGTPNAMNAAWGGIADDDEIMVCLSSHKTTDNLAANPDCTIAIGTAEQVVACDYVGIATGNRVPDKLAKANWTTTKAAHVNAPIINELPLCIECTLHKVVDGCKYFFKIKNVSADDRILTNGKIDLAKFHPLTYSPADYGYYPLGAKVGNAFADGKKIK